MLKTPIALAMFFALAPSMSLAGDTAAAPATAAPAAAPDATHAKKKGLDSWQKEWIQFNAKQRQKRWDFEDKMQAEERAFHDAMIKERRNWELKTESELLSSEDPGATQDKLKKDREERTAELKKKQEDERKKWEAEKKAFAESLDQDKKAFRETLDQRKKLAMEKERAGQ